MTGFYAVTYREEYERERQRAWERETDVVSSDNCCGFVSMMSSHSQRKAEQQYRSAPFFPSSNTITMQHTTTSRTVFTLFHRLSIKEQGGVINRKWWYTESSFCCDTNEDEDAAVLPYVSPRYNLTYELWPFFTCISVNQSVQKRAGHFDICYSSERRNVMCEHIEDTRTQHCHGQGQRGRVSLPGHTLKETVVFHSKTAALTVA